MNLDKFERSTSEIVKAMFDLAEIKPGEKHIELGSGDGRFIQEAIKRGAISIGYETDIKLTLESRKKGLKVINKDCFKANVSKADVITFWFTLLPETQLLMDKLLKEMKKGARLVKRGRNDYSWQPKKTIKVGRQYICLYIK